MFCPNCGKELKDTARFCNYCGKVILKNQPNNHEPVRTAKENVLKRNLQNKLSKLQKYKESILTGEKQFDQVCQLESNAKTRMIIFAIVAFVFVLLSDFGNIFIACMNVNSKYNGILYENFFQVVLEDGSIINNIGGQFTECIINTLCVALFAAFCCFDEKHRTFSIIIPFMLFLLLLFSWRLIMNIAEKEGIIISENIEMQSVYLNEFIIGIVICALYLIAVAGYIHSSNLARLVFVVSGGVFIIMISINTWKILNDYDPCVVDLSGLFLILTELFCILCNSLAKILMVLDLIICISSVRRFVRMNTNRNMTESGQISKEL